MLSWRTPQCSSPDRRYCYIGLLLPTLFVHAVDEKPHDAHKRPDDAGANDVGLQAFARGFMELFALRFLC